MRNRVLICAVLAAITLVVYWPVGNCDFINYDDPVYVVNNPFVQGGITMESLRWAFSTTHAANWHPLTWLSHMIDCRIFGLDPRGHHFTNLGFHIINTLLLFLLLARATGAMWRSMLVAALFALHPLHVESVAWIAERKDVLSASFWFLTMFLYIGYVARPGPVRYLAVLFCFAAGLMAKPMLVTLPFVLLLMDYWPIGRWGGGTPVRRLLWEKLPLFALAVASSVITFYAQKMGGSVISLHEFSFPERLANALLAWLRYLAKMVWPTRLSVIYPMSPDLSVWTGFSAGIILVAATFLLWRAGRRRPYLIVGWLWYLGTLVPVIGLVQVGSQAMADRYTYIPFVGLFIMVAWGIADLVDDLRNRQIAFGVAAISVMAVLAVSTRHQLGYWRDSYTLFSHAVKVTQNNYKAYNEVGVALARQGKFNEADGQFQESIRINPLFADTHYNWGVALFEQRKIDEALRQYSEAIHLNPDFAEAHYNIGIVLYQIGKIDEAIFHFNEALRIDPTNISARDNLNICLNMKAMTAPRK
jgi:tetratricopeptide (TPR) repeat protein